MTSQSKICLVGDVVVDLSLKTNTTPTKMRLGGIAHAARALWALGIPYDVIYFAPAFMDEQIVNFFEIHGGLNIYKGGNVVGAPYVFIIEEVKEIGDQGYEFILRDEIKIVYDYELLDSITFKSYEDMIMISGNYDENIFFSKEFGRIHIDVSNNVSDMGYFSSINKKIHTIFISTSSTIFKRNYHTDYNDFMSGFQPYCETVILKENRGGSRGVKFSDNVTFSAGSQTQPIVHSVGVGDIFDVCYVVKSRNSSVEEALTFSSWIASEYAQTTYPEDFKRQVERISKTDVSILMKLHGVQLPWELREHIHIYIAAPDFDYVDRSPIERLNAALIYHNFKPRRPIIENGQMEVGASKTRKQELFLKDMGLLDNCQILVAVLLFNDPGTLIEIGLAAAKGLPVLVYDPYNTAVNCILTELPKIVSNDLDSIISEIFIQSNKLINGSK